MNTNSAPTPAPMIVAEGLSCGYGDTPVLRELNFTVRSGEAFFIIGGSGCGKTTLLRTLIGLQAPLAGSIQIRGLTLRGASPAARRELLQTFGVLYQSAALWSSFTLRENVAFPLTEYTSLSRREVHELAALKLAQVGLAGFEDHYPAEISGGMKKRAGLARALALDPAVLFLDEPGAGLDPPTARKLDELVRSLREQFGTTLVIVSHALASIHRMADRVILLDKTAQGIIAEGSPGELLRHSRDPQVTDFLRWEMPSRTA